MVRKGRAAQECFGGCPPRKPEGEIEMRLKRAAKKEFQKLAKKEQRRINNLKRVPVAKPGHVMDQKTPPRKKKWDETD